MHYLQEEIGMPKMKTQKTGGSSSGSAKGFAATFTVSPLPPGYGTTIGNAFRRVLLSSLPGAAVTGVKIAGVNYEYATLKGVSDSVLDIILNLKQLHVKKSSTEPTWIKLRANKEGAVTAKDIECPSEVEILNPDLYITTIEKGSKLEMDIRIEKGVGYMPISQMQKDEDMSDLILVDAFFSPVKKVQYDIEAARVGGITNLDKMTLDVETNGAIEPEDALKFAANLLQSYFNLFNMEGVLVEPDFLTDVDKIAEKEREEETAKPQQQQYTPIEILGLSPRTLNALINGEIGSIEQLVECTESKLSNLRGFGKKALNEVASALESRGLAMKND